MTAGVRIGVSGHQSRPEIDWAWTAERIHDVLIGRAPVIQAFTSLAVGTDQVFAIEALALGIPVTAVIPMPDYERCFAAEDLPHYRELVRQCAQLRLDGAESNEEAFYRAGRYVADSCDLLVAIWDGRPAAGFGGTADIVRYCMEVGRHFVHINPIAYTVSPLL